ncbi:non-ribosomal peptide synthetase [Rhizobium sp. FKL33]|uniref:non-ribosomal peptide synthetase n=1 Tax=Rhizobium sp. FKL33 TaxID=2562307 RepID=UPI0010C06129|nr:non-ribosomal peptide synthetase [Rhizobium sp. FKL33]
MPAFPLLSTQLGIWLADQVASRRNRYLIAHGIELQGAVDIGRFSAAIRGGLAEADTVIARYIEDDAGAWQVIPESASAENVAEPEVLDFSDHADPDADMRQLIEADLTASAAKNVSLCRQILIRLGDVQGQPRWFWYQRYHHVMLDGFSFTTLTRRIAELYTASLDGAIARPSPFGPVSEVLAEYDAYRASDAASRDCDFWQRYCEDLPPVFSPSFRTGRPMAAHDGRPSEYLHRLEDATLPALEDIARDRNLAVFDILSAAICAYLHRLSGSGEQVVGIPFMRRMGSSALASSAPVVNVLPVRVEIDGGQTVLEVAEAVKTALRQVRKHQRYDAEQIQRDLGLVGTGRALYGAVINYRMFDYDLRFGEIRAATHHLATGPVDDIEFGILIDDGHVTLELRGETPLYDQTDLARHSRRLALMIGAFIADKATTIDDLPLMEPTEAALLAEHAAGPGVERPEAFQSIIDVFAAQAEATPDAVALVFGDTRLTFAETAGRVFRLARYLQAHGIGPGDIVAVAMPRSADVVTTMLAVMASGAAHMPLDLDYPPERLTMMCEDARPKAVITTRPLVDDLPHGPLYLCLDDPALIGICRALSAQALDASPSADSIAYVIFTSGSTGRPKGVINAHGALLNLFLSHKPTIYQPSLAVLQAHHPERALRAAHTHSFAFDSSWLQIFWMLHGQELHIIDEDLRRDAQGLADAIAERQIDALDLPPSFCTQMLNCGLLASGRHRPTVLLIGGEAMSAALWDMLHPHAATLHIHNLYGPTEYTVDALRAPIDMADHPVIGRPIGDSRAHVLDDRLRPVAIGVTGELYLAGAGLARGYIGRPDLTAQRFVANPFEPGAIMYRTGDRVRWNENGQIEFLGRVDHQVKVRGYRIETAEVELAIQALDGVQTVLVMAEAVNGSHRLVAYCTVTDKTGVDRGALAARLRFQLAQKLPDYMVPSVMMVIDAFPLTINGKVDRSRLPAPSVAVETAPSTPAEALVCAAIAHVLKLPDVGADSDFFSLGGDSINAIMLCNALRAEGYVIRPRDIFAARDARGLARLMTPVVALAPAGVDATASNVSDAETALLAKRYGPIETVLPVLATQKGMLFHAALGDRAGSYNAFTRLTLSGPLDAERLSRAFDAVLRRHPQLGAVFDLEGRDEPLLVVPAFSPKARGLWPFELHDVSHLPEQEGRAAFARIEANATEREHFGPAFRRLLSATLIRTSATEHVLLILVHHLMIDGWSTPLLLGDLFEAYRRNGATLTPLRTGYADVVKQLDRRDPTASRLAWRDALAGVTPTRLFDQIAPTAMVEESEFRLSEASTQALTARARAEGVTLNVLMQSVWALVLGSMTGRDDVVFGTPVAGRSSPIEGLADQIGLFLNTIPVRIALQPEQGLWEQARALQTKHAALMEHDGLGLGEIQSLAGLGNLFDTLLVVENYPDSSYLDQDLDGLAIRDIHNRGYSHYPLALLVLPGRELTLLLENRGAIAGSRALVERVAALLEALIWEGDVKVAALPVCSKTDRQAIDTVNETDHALPPLTLRDLLLAQAGRTPDAMALIDADHELSFRQVRQQSLHLAARLRREGVRTGDIVAVALPRSARLSVALLAVIEAGAAFLPLDLSYPADRLAFMLEDATPRLLITDAETHDRISGDVPALLFDHFCDRDVEVREIPEAAELLPDHPAYVLYTSGTTGRPKGAIVSHAAIVNRILWMQNTYPLDGKDVILQKTPCGFDVSVWEFFWSYIIGARLVMAPTEAHRDPAALIALIETHGVTTLHFVPSMLAIFIATARDLRSHGPLCPSMRLVFCSGEALAKGLSRDFATLFGAELHNLYGPTEAAIDVSFAPAMDELIAGEGSVPIGLPVWNTRLHILDHLLRPVPAGVAGELYLAGVQLGIGYLGRPELTASRFVANPFSAGERMYRTGDLARSLPGGRIEYLGRTDHQIKIRGQRVELGEIEAQIEKLPGVAQAVVSAMSLGQAGMAGADERQLVAHVVPTANVSLALSTFANALKAVLPTHMVPVAFVEMQTLPLSANGKLDRKALPMPSLAGGVGTGRAPAEGLESKTAAIFAELLERESVGADEDFFAIGGHSLLAMRLAARIRRDLGRQISVGQIMTMPTVAKLAEHMIAGELVSDMAKGGFETVIRLRDGTGAPLICIYPASGVSWQYSVLSRYLRQDMPIVGLQSPRPHGPIAASETMDDLWGQQLAILRGVQPKGPYYLLGYSLGGTIAYGLAVKLRALGEEVRFLGLLDTYPSEVHDWTDPDGAQANQGAEREQEQFINDAMADVMDDDFRREKEEMFGHIFENYRDSVELLSKASTPDYDGHLTLFVAGKSLLPGIDPEASWTPRVGGLSIHRLAHCSHEDIISPASLETLGPLLDALIRDAETMADTKDTSGKPDRLAAASR